MTSRVSKWFSDRELECSCGCGASDVHPELLAIADATRESLGVPLKCNSAVRCRDYNSSPAVQGSENSFHIPRGDGFGYAMDLTMFREGDRSPLGVARLYIELEKHARHIPGVGLGLYHWGCHIDVRGLSDDKLLKWDARWEGDFPWPRLCWPRTP